MINFLKNIRQTILALAATFTAICAVAVNPEGYYDAAQGLSGEELKTALFQIIRPHTVVKYSSLFPEQFPQTDVYPDTCAEGPRWWDMYSDQVFLVENGGEGLNREHSFPKSWWGGDTHCEAYTDLYHMYPAEAKANLAKSNYPLGEVEVETFNNGVSRVGHPYAGQGGGANRVFEPADEYKGDFARTYMYMATCYQDYTWKYTYMVEDGAYPTLTPWATELLLRWDREDPVSDKERTRVEAVYAIQGNRNPFIDLPELAEHIWGNLTAVPYDIPDDSVDDIEAGESLSAVSIAGGVRLIVGAPQRELSIASATGALNWVSPCARETTDIALPPGIYLITSHSGTKPLKIAVR